MDEASLQGQLLIASPALRDPNFHRSVVLIAEHGEGGAMGVILNRPADAAAAEALPALEDILEPDAVVFAGGPVEPQAVIVLAEFADPDEAATLVFDDVGFVRGDAEPAELAEEEAWIIEPPLLEDVFSDDPGGLWSAVLRRKGGRFALVATMPLDPSLN
jgi:putative transcriptional regulator